MLTRGRNLAYELQGSAIVCGEKADPGTDWDWNNAPLHKEHTKKLMHRERLSHDFTLIFVIPKKKCSLFAFIFNKLKRWRTQHGTVLTIRLRFKEQLRLMLTSFFFDLFSTLKNHMFFWTKAKNCLNSNTEIIQKLKAGTDAGPYHFFNSYSKCCVCEWKDMITGIVRRVCAQKTLGCAVKYTHYTLSSHGIYNLSTRSLIYGSRGLCWLQTKDSEADS